MKLRADYHTHTTYSDGKTSHEDNVKQAIKKGLQTIGISDHGWGHVFYGFKKDKLEEIKQEIKRLRAAYPMITILLSVEANILGEDGELDLKEEDFKHFDMVLAGYHFGSRIRSPKDLRFHTINFLNSKLGLFKKQAMKQNTLALTRAMRRYNFQLLTHPGDKGAIDLLEVARVAEETGIALEINERHTYLTTEQLRTLKDMDLHFILSSDAHYIDHIGSVDEGLQRIKDSGIDLKKIVNVSEEDS